jgi:hypothetical protein
VVHIAVEGPVDYVHVLPMYAGQEAIALLEPAQNSFAATTFDSVDYMLPDDPNPHVAEIPGARLSPADTPGLYEWTTELNNIPLSSDYRIRITAADTTAKNFAFVDFRPVPIAGEGLDLDGDGLGG